MNTLYGYRFTIRRDIYYNDEYSHCIRRTPIAHDPRKLMHPYPQDFKVELERMEIERVSDSLTIRTSDEFVTGVEYLGRVCYRTEVYYEKGEYPE